MNQQEAIGYIQDILPQISHSSDAEDVLLKFAHDKNLAPAQVERLGQVFNNAKTLTFLEKAANRGGSFPVVNTENLVARYTDLPETLPSQSPGRSDAVIEWVGDDIKSASEQDCLESFPSLDGLKKSNDSFIGEPDAVSKKEASELDAHIQHLHKVAAADQCRVDGEFLDMFEEEQKDLIRDKVASIVDEIRMGELDWDTSIKAAAYLLGPDKYGQVQSIVKSASNGRLDAVDMEFEQLDEEFGFSPEDRSSEEIKSLHSKLASITESFELLTIAREERDSILGVKEAGTATEQEKDTDEEYLEGINPNTVGSKTPGNASSKRTSNTTAGKPESRERPTTRAQQSDKEDEGKEKGDGSRKSDDGGVSKGFEKFLDGLGQGVERATEKTGPTSVLAGIKNTINEGRSSNKAQRAVDEGMSDAATQVALTQALRDPIIAEADPEMVVSLFNSMRSVNPGFVEDPNNLIMALREAVQYDSIPIHTLKELIDMNLSQGKVEAEQHKNMQTRYGNPSTKG